MRWRNHKYRDNGVHQRIRPCFFQQGGRVYQFLSDWVCKDTLCINIYLDLVLQITLLYTYAYVEPIILRGRKCFNVYFGAQLYIISIIVADDLGKVYDTQIDYYEGNICIFGVMVPRYAIYTATLVFTIDKKRDRDTTVRQSSVASLSPLQNTPLTHPPPPGQNGRHFVDDHIKCMFVNETFCVWVRISLKFVPTGPIDNNLALV